MIRTPNREEFTQMFLAQLSGDLPPLFTQMHVLRILEVPGTNARAYLQVLTRERDGLGIIRYQYNFGADVVELPRIIVEIAPRDLYWDAPKPPKWLTELPKWQKHLSMIQFEVED